MIHRGIFFEVLLHAAHRQAEFRELLAKLPSAPSVFITPLWTYPQSLTLQQA